MKEHPSQIVNELLQALGYAETGPKVSTGLAAAGCRAVSTWLNWLVGFLNGIPVTNDRSGQVSLLMLLHYKALTRELSDEEYRDAAMVTEIVAALDRFFDEIAPQRLQHGMQTSPS